MLKIIQDEKIDEEIIKMHTPISKLLCIIALSCTTPLYAKSNDQNQTSCQEVKFQDISYWRFGHLHSCGAVGSERTKQSTTDAFHPYVGTWHIAPHGL